MKKNNGHAFNVTLVSTELKKKNQLYYMVYQQVVKNQLYYMVYQQVVGPQHHNNSRLRRNSNESLSKPENSRTGG